MIVKMAREQNSLVLVCATLPFSFEGKRRGQQAQEALRAIQQYADAVMCFENDRMGELILPEAGIHEAFAGADQIIGQSVKAVVDLVNRRGLIHLGFDDLLSALRSHDSRCLFGYGEASGSTRGREALAQALRNPLMDRGSLLGQAANVLVNIVGGPDLTLAEVQNVMEDLSEHIGERTQLLFGAAVDPKLGGRLGVTLISSLGARAGTGSAAPRAGKSGGYDANLSAIGSNPVEPRASDLFPQPAADSRRSQPHVCPRSGYGRRRTERCGGRYHREYGAWTLRQKRADDCRWRRPRRTDIHAEKPEGEIASLAMASRSVSRRWSGLGLEESGVHRFEAVNLRQYAVLPDPGIRVVRPNFARIAPGVDGHHRLAKCRRQMCWSAVYTDHKRRASGEPNQLSERGPVEQVYAPAGTVEIH